MTVLVAVLSSGCAYQYYDKKTGTEHLWGVGHLKMRAVPQNGDQSQSTNTVTAFVTGVHTMGIAVYGGQELAGLALGYESHSRVTIKQDDTAFYLIWPTNSVWRPRPAKDLFAVRIGTVPPFVQAEQTQPTTHLQP